jgi:hypothetical protein
MISLLSRCLMRSGADPRLWLVLAHLEHAAGDLDLRPDAPPRCERAREGGIREVDREGVIQQAVRSRGVVAHPSEPQFSSSQGWSRLERGEPGKVRWLRASRSVILLNRPFGRDQYENMGGSSCHCSSLKVASPASTSRAAWQSLKIDRQLLRGSANKWAES